jgi:MYXO-CTERM domain-containing protein
MSDSDPGSSNVSSKLKVILGALLLLVAARLWQRRPSKGMAATSSSG